MALCTTHSFFIRAKNTKRGVIRAFLQPLSGLKLILFGGWYALSLVFFPITLFINYRKANLHNKDFNIKVLYKALKHTFIYNPAAAIICTLRGITSILLFPIAVIKLPIRLYITSKKGNPDFLHNEGVKRQYQAAVELLNKKEDPNKIYTAIKKLHLKFRKNFGYFGDFLLNETYTSVSLNSIPSAFLDDTLQSCTAPLDPLEKNKPLPNVLITPQKSPANRSQYDTYKSYDSLRYFFQLVNENRQKNDERSFRQSESQYLQLFYEKLHAANLNDTTIIEPTC